MTSPASQVGPPTTDYSAIVLLADAAQVSAGKISMLGAGWNTMGPGTAPMAVVVRIEVPWTGQATSFAWGLDLIDSDGHPVMTATADGETSPVSVSGHVNVTAPSPDAVAGVPLVIPVTVSFPALPLAAPARYEWRFSIDGRNDERWNAAFACT